VPREPATPYGGHKVLKVPAAPSRRPHGADATGCAPKMATRSPGDRPRPHGGLTGHRGPVVPPRRTHGDKGTGCTPTADSRVIGERLSPNADTGGTRHRPHPHGGHTWVRGPVTPPRRTHVAQGTGHAPRRTHMAQETGHVPTAATRGPGHRPCIQGGHTRPRGPATYG